MRAWPINLRYEVLFRGRWKLGGYYGGNTREEADARAIDRLQHLWSGQVRKIRRVENELVIWERPKQEKAA